MVFCKLPVGPDRLQLPENCCRESFGNCLHASVSQRPRLANIKGKPTKRIVCTLTTESSGGNRPTYEKELLNPRKKQPFLQNESSRLPPCSAPYEPNDNILRIYARNDRNGRGPGNDTPLGRKFEGHHTNQACYKSGIASQNTNADMD